MSDEREALQQRAEAVAQLLRETLSEDTGLPVERFSGLAVSDLQAVREEYTEIRDADAEERAAMQDLAREVAAAQAGMTSDDYAEKVNREQVMEHARKTGDWGPYLRWRASDERNLDRRSEQGQGSRAEWR